MANDDNPPVDSEQPEFTPEEARAHQIVTLLGQSVIVWSHVERSLEMLVNVLFCNHGLLMEDARVVTSNLDIREKAKIALALAYKAGLSARQLGKLAEVVNSVQNDLRNRRNRLYHDVWMMKDSILSKQEATGTRLHRPQAHRLELYVPQFEPIEAETIEKFLTDCFAASHALTDEAHNIVSRMEERMQSKSGERSPRPKTFWSRLLRRES